MLAIFETPQDRKSSPAVQRISFRTAETDQAWFSWQPSCQERTYVLLSKWWPERTCAWDGSFWSRRRSWLIMWCWWGQVWRWRIFRRFGAGWGCRSSWRTMRGISIVKRWSFWARLKFSSPGTLTPLRTLLSYVRKHCQTSPNPLTQRHWQSTHSQTWSPPQH